MKNFIERAINLIKKAGIVYIVGSSALFTLILMLTCYFVIEDKFNMIFMTWASVINIVLMILFIFIFALIIILEIIWFVLKCSKSDSKDLMDLITKSKIARTGVIMVCVFTITIIVLFLSIVICEKNDRKVAASNTEDGYYYCTNCNAILDEQEGFNKDKEYHVCTECGIVLLNDRIATDHMKYKETVWFCDECGDCLNAQFNFSDYLDKWTCTKCGYINEINDENSTKGNDKVKFYNKNIATNSEYNSISDGSSEDSSEEKVNDINYDKVEILA